MLTALGDEAQESDLLKFNQLKFRRKAMKFGKIGVVIPSFGLNGLINICKKSIGRFYSVYN
jgi:hypothetical protein